MLFMLICAVVLKELCLSQGADLDTCILFAATRSARRSGAAVPRSSTRLGRSPRLPSQILPLVSTVRDGNSVGSSCVFLLTCPSPLSRMVANGLIWHSAATVNIQRFRIRLTEHLPIARQASLLVHQIHMVLLYLHGDYQSLASRATNIRHVRG